MCLSDNFVRAGWVADMNAFLELKHLMLKRWFSCERTSSLMMYSAASSLNGGKSESNFWQFICVDHISAHTSSSALLSTHLSCLFL